eukprot:PhM_4_TR11635/c0_g1_i1/m.20320/K17301/COPB1, SEC26; coatomer subunit beta
MTQNVTAQEFNNTLLVSHEGATPNAKELREAVEKGDIPTKIATVQQIIRLHLSGENMGHFVMPIIKFCVPSEDHTLKKLLLYFWECVEKTDGQGRLLPEMILLVSFLRNDLRHPNEYIRGLTLRFLGKLKEGDIIEPLVPCIVDCLAHRHSYVRRAAVAACHNIFLRFPNMMSDVPEAIEAMLDDETDISTRRNGFVMLFHCAPQRAISFLRKTADSIEPASGSNESFNLALVDLLKQLIIRDPQDKSQYVRIIFSLLQSKSPALLFQCASTLLSLSSSPTALRQAVQTFTQLLNTYSDNNVKLIILDRITALRQSFPGVLQENLVDLLRGLSTTNTDIRRKILDLCVSLVNDRNVESFVQYMKKELIRATADGDNQDRNAADYQELIIKALHTSVTRHLRVAPTVVPIVLDFITANNSASADIILFVREMIVRCPSLREEILTKLSALFPSITSVRVLRTCLWIFGAHCKTLDEVTNVFSTVKGTLGPLPLVKELTVTTQHSNEPELVTACTTSVREDGTYATNITTVDKSKLAAASGESTLRTAITNGDFFLACALCSCLSKLVVHVFSAHATQSVRNELQVDATEVMREILHYGVSEKMDDDAYERIKFCLAVVQHPKAEVLTSLLDACKQSYDELLASQQPDETVVENKVTVVPVDQPISFSQLSKNAGSSAAIVEDEDILVATSNDALDNEKDDFIKRLNRVLQLTGFGDPVYAEATVTVHQFDILIEMLVVNQTPDTLENLTVEFATIGDLKLCERPQNYAVGPNSSVTIRASIKVSGTETAVIFGNIVYDIAGTLDRNCVVLNDMHIDVMDYVVPAKCTPVQFRSMWADFEWENKVQVATNLTTPAEYIEALMRNTNMTCMATGASSSGEYDFLSANLYAKTIFGEDALANVSLERSGADGKLEGYVRLRSATQGIALSLGEKIAAKQKEA